VLGDISEKSSNEGSALMRETSIPTCAVAIAEDRQRKATKARRKFGIDNARAASSARDLGMGSLSELRFYFVSFRRAASLLSLRIPVKRARSMFDASRAPGCQCDALMSMNPPALGIFSDSRVSALIILYWSITT